MDLSFKFRQNSTTQKNHNIADPTPDERSNNQPEVMTYRDTKLRMGHFDRTKTMMNMVMGNYAVQRFKSKRRTLMASSHRVI